MPKPPKTWKHSEKQIAKNLGGTRVSHTHLGLSTCDIELGGYAIEVKTRRVFPVWLLDMMQQAEKNARQGQTGVLILHKLGWRYEVDDLVLMRIGDWKELIAKSRPETTAIATTK